MVRHADHHDNGLLRANRTIFLSLLWGGLGACVAGSVIYDAGRLFNAW